MRKNMLQIGFSIIIGWIILIVCFTVIQTIIHPGGEEMFWVMLFLGLGLMSSRIVLKVKERFNTLRKILLQIGVVVTIIWIQILIMREGPHGLGFYLGYTATRYGIMWGDMFYSIPVLMIVVYPVLGLILIALGIVLKRKNENRSIEE